jgi:hypothetical protein
VSATILQFPTKRAAEQAWAAFNEHANKIFDNPELRHDPEWEAERQRLHKAFYRLFERLPYDRRKVTPIWSRG